jgi:hypothetical protein
MNTPLPTALLAAIVYCAIPVPAAAAADTKGDAAKAGDRCEEAVAETVRRMRGREAQEVEFVGAKRAVAPAADADETAVKGEGRYRSPGGAMSFTYSCAFNTKTGGTSGVLFRETGGTRAGTGVAWEPDLTHFSPEACETAAASQLKQKYPRVGRIAFGSDSRQRRPAADAHTSVEGQGAVQRAPGMNSIPFRYRCEIETRSGKVVNVTTTD